MFITSRTSALRYFNFLFLSVWALLHSSSTFAVALEKPSGRSIEGGFYYLNLQSPTQEQIERTSYQVSLRHHIPLLNYPTWLKFDASFVFAPDEAISKDVDIRQDFYFLTTAASYEFTKLFRYRIGLGPIYSFDYTNIRVLKDTHSSSGQDYGLQAKLDVDYGFSDSWELRMHTGLFNRFVSNRIDWFYGLAVGWNF